MGLGRYHRGRCACRLPVVNGVLIVGGARSGKSRFGERLALHCASQCGAEPRARPLYVATSRAWDAEHQARITRHRRDRDPRFETVELEKELASVAAPARVYLVDCVTLWLTNWYTDLGGDTESALHQAERELSALSSAPGTWLLVSNELGQGVVPDNAVARGFVDLSGFVNQRLAAMAEVVVWTAVGLPQLLKGADTPLGRACVECAGPLGYP